MTTPQHFPPLPTGYEDAIIRLTRSGRFLLAVGGPRILVLRGAEWLALEGEVLVETRREDLAARKGSAQ